MGELSDDSGVVYAWDAKLLNGLDLSNHGVSFQRKFNLTNPDEGIVIRPLSNADFDKGFTKVLAQLTKVGTVSKADFIKRFNAMKSAGGYYTVVVEDTTADNGRGRIVGTGTLEVEQKFIHSCALRGRIEEVVVDGEYRGRKFGKIILALATELGKKLGCYKISLECTVDNMEFYGKFGFKETKERYLLLRFRD